MSTQKPVLSLIRALFIIDRNWKQTRCPSIVEWINCDTFIHEVLFSSEKKSVMKPQKRHGTLNEYC